MALLVHDPTIDQMRCPRCCFRRGLGAATGRGRPAPRQRDRDTGPGRAGPASGATTSHWPDARSTAPPARRGPAWPRLSARCLSERRSLVRRSPTGAAQCSRRLAMPEPSIQRARHAAGVHHLVEPRQRHQLVLVAAVRPAAVTPQTVAMDGGHRHALGGVGVAVGVGPDRLVGPAAGSLPPGRQPVNHGRLAGSDPLPKALAQVRKGGDEPAVGLAGPERGEPGEQ